MEAAIGHGDDFMTAHSTALLMTKTLLPRSLGPVVPLPRNSTERLL